MEELNLSEICTHCHSEQTLKFKFCSKCGQRNFRHTTQEKNRSAVFETNLQLLSAYALVSVVLLVAYFFLEDTFETLLMMSLLFAAIDVGFAYYQPDVWKLFKVSLRPIPLLVILAICLASGFAITYFSDTVNILLYEETDLAMPVFDGLTHPLAWALLLTAVFPALFEELAFRGFVFNNLLVISGEKSAIWGSTFLFALIHFSILSLLWLIPFGLLLAHYRKTHNTLIYGIIGHFTHNATTVFIEYYGWM